MGLAREKVWIEIKEKLGLRFDFTEISDEHDNCIGLINGDELYEQGSKYDDLTRRYIWELREVGAESKHSGTTELKIRIEVLNEQLSRARDLLAKLKARPYKIQQFPSNAVGPNGEVLYDEIYDPPCAKSKIEACEKYGDFIHLLINISNRFIARWSDSRSGFNYKGNLDDLKGCYDYLKNRYIECDYKNFKNIFSGKSAPKINWIGKAGALKYFIKGITATGRLTVSNKWKRTTECFNLDGRTIASTGKISGAQKNLLQSTKDELNQAISFLFPMSQQ